MIYTEANVYDDFLMITHSLVYSIFLCDDSLSEWLFISMHTGLCEHIHLCEHTVKQLC